MANNFVPVGDTETLDGVLERSHEEPVVLFKHSTTCPISSAAHREMERYSGAVNLVVVQTARPVSREIENRTGVRHESPQALVLRNGAVVWTASHYDITADAVRRAVEQHA